MTIPVVDGRCNVIAHLRGRGKGKQPKLAAFTAWTDGGLISSYGKIPTIVLDPGNLESAHSSGEFLDV